MSDCGEEKMEQPVTDLSDLALLCDEPGPSHGRFASWGEYEGPKFLPINIRPPPGQLSDTQCEQLASELESNPFAFKHLDLRRNSVNESGAELLFAALESPKCKLRTLRLRDCVLSERSWASLASALKVNPSYLRELDLSGNKYLTESGVKLLSDGLKSKHCRLEILRLVGCELTESSCASLVSGLESSCYFLKELDLSGNCLQDSGVKLLCAGLKSKHCSLEILRLVGCELTESSCASLVSGLESSRYSLTELDLSGNCLQDSGVKLLCAGFKHQYLFFTTLRLSSCSLSEKSCESLVSTLHRFNLEVLDLSLNQLWDSGIKVLSAGLRSPHCKLKTLRLKQCLFSDEGCASLVSALKSNPYDLTELDLSGNKLRTEGMNLLSEFVKSPHCTLQTLRVDYGQNLITVETSARLESLRFEPREMSHTSWLDFDIDWSYDMESLYPTPWDVNTQGRLRQEAAGISVPEVWSPVMNMAPSDDPDLTQDLQTTNTEFDLSEDNTEALSHFTPEVSSEREETSYRFSCPHPGVYQCDLTRLRFTMSWEGKLSFRVVQWDEQLLQAAGKVPAGPLFDIKCPEDAVSQLHLPHCETTPVLPSDGLSVVHISDHGMSILDPQEITETHVVVDVPHLSAFGLVWDLIERFLNIQKPISAQVLLFHQPTYSRQRRKLTVFLLPENVPLQEVKVQRENTEYIEVPSICQLIKGHTYSLDCPEACKIQPVSALFDLKYGPNYHPTFEIRLNLSTEEATVTVQDQEKKLVWEYNIDLTDLRPELRSAAPSIQPQASDPGQAQGGSDSSSASGSAPTEPASVHVAAGGGGPDPSGQNLPRRGDEERRLFSVRTDFIERVSSSVLNELLDVLLENRVINSGEMESIQALPRADKARELIDSVRRKGNRACRILIQNFCVVDPFLSSLLKLR